jgi:redox-sensitive bicupin YhaK (pirin superfamily)
MIEIRPFAELGRYENDWLAARHHFSFGDYHDPARGGLGPLLVWNDDTIAPGRGFDLHGHRDMEIVTFVREGAITHRDHLGNEGRTEAGDVQVMSAGKGILHAEYNLEDVATRIFQIWIRPRQTGAKPRWEQRRFPAAERGGRLVALASGRPGADGADGADAAVGAGGAGALAIHQDAAILGARLRAGDRVGHPLGAGRRAYLVADRGGVEVNGRAAGARDGVVVAGEETLEIVALADADVVVADVP